MRMPVLYGQILELFSVIYGFHSFLKLDAIKVTARKEEKSGQGRGKIKNLRVEVITKFAPFMNPF